jgi:hypothetical protein
MALALKAARPSCATPDLTSSMYSVSSPGGLNPMIHTGYSNKDLQDNCLAQSHFWLVQIPLKFSADISRFTVKWSNMRAL